VQIVLAALLRVVLLWVSSAWKPSFTFNFDPIKKLLPFSINLLFSGIIDVLASNIQMLLIGKYYTASDLGFYSQAKILSAMPSQILTSIVKNVTYPVLSVIKDDASQLKQAYRKIITIAMFVIVPVMFILVAIGNSLIPFVLGEKWIPSIDYFMLLSFVGAIYPLYSINQNIFLAMGNSKLLLKVSIVQKLIAVGGIFITIQISVLALVIGYVITTIINTLIIMYYAGKEINYNLKEQINDIMCIILISFFMFTCVYFFGIKIHLANPLLTMLIQISMGIVIYFTLVFLFKLSALTEFKDILLRIKNNNINIIETESEEVISRDIKLK
jgi:O-antigen/teichoic acid export membrane protein